jgi:hypothetical protein
LIVYCFTSRSRIFHLRAAKFRRRAFEQGGTLSCHTCCDTGPRFFQSHPKDCPIQLPLPTHKGMWRIYSNPDPHGNFDIYTGTIYLHLLNACKYEPCQIDGWFIVWCLLWMSSIFDMYIEAINFYLLNGYNCLLCQKDIFVVYCVLLMPHVIVVMFTNNSKQFLKFWYLYYFGRHVTRSRRNMHTLHLHCVCNFLSLNSPSIILKKWICVYIILPIFLIRILVKDVVRPVFLYNAVIVKNTNTQHCLALPAWHSG